MKEYTLGRKKLKKPTGANFFFEKVGIEIVAKDDSTQNFNKKYYANYKGQSG